MSSIRIWYNKNREKIWIAIIMFAVVIALTQTLNKYYKDNPKEKDSYSNTIYNTDTYSVITKKEINESSAKESINLINYFMKFCNNGQPEEAYKLLSLDCKEELYPTIDTFITKYYNKVFTEKKSYDYMLWIVGSESYTYRVEIISDILATGKKDDMPTEDYFTIVAENGQNKLNISRYIGKEDINLVQEQDNITITILSKIQYMDYEKYKISVLNNTGSKLVFNKKENLNSIYIQDENNVEYVAFLNEIPSTQFEIPSGAVNTLEIKFNRGYKPTIDVENIVFEDVYTNMNSKTIKVEI